MGILIRDIIELPVMEHARLLAGASGLQRSVEGIALLESTDSTKYLTKNTLVLNNAQLIKDNPEWSMNLIYALYNKGCAGLAIKISRHIPELPEAILSSANKLGFPVIALPAHCTSTQLITTITYEIIRSEYHDLSYRYDKDFLMSLLLDDEHSTILRNQGIALGWSLKKSLGSAILFPVFPEIQPQLQELSKQHGFTWMLANPRHYILICDLEKIEKPEIFLEKSSFSLADTIQKQFPDYAFHLGVGRAYKKLLYTSKSYKEAQIALAMNIAEKNKCPVTCFSQMGIFRILLNPTNQEELQQIIDSSIHILGQYDRENGTEYYKTFLSFYEHNASIKETSAALYVHYNTIRHRLSTINQILNVPVTNSYSLSIKSLMLILQWQKIYEEIRH